MLLRQRKHVSYILSLHLYNLKLDKNLNNIYDLFSHRIIHFM